MSEFHQPQVTYFNEELEPRYDFTHQLTDALMYAPTYDLTPSGTSTDKDVKEKIQLGKESEGLTDTEVMSFIFTPEISTGMVYTTDEAAYYDLVIQGLEMINYEWGDTAAILRQAAYCHRHELQHANETKRVNPDAEVRFCFEILRGRQPDGTSRFGHQPSVLLAGDFRKIDLASIFLAPDQPSESDFRAARALGYGSLQEVIERRALIDGSAANSILAFA